MVVRVLACWLGVLGALGASWALGDEFERLEADVISRLIAVGAVETRDSLTSRDLDAFDSALREARAALLFVKTDRGNFARILATAALRRAVGSQSEPVPVICLERFDCFEPGKSSSRLARGRDLFLFEGFRVDLDAGIVVPEGQGGDLVLAKGGDGGIRLQAMPGSTLHVATKPLELPPPTAGPSPGRLVVPTDFSGHYRLSADGRASGRLELNAGADRQVTGTFRSEPNGGAYPLTGEVRVESPNLVVFTIRFPRSEQVYEGYLASEGKMWIAGSFTMLDKTFGFLATREGAEPERK